MSSPDSAATIGRSGTAGIPPERNCRQDAFGVYLAGVYVIAVALPIGGAGLFGTREVSASFDALGRPTELSFGSDPGAAAIAGIIDAAGETATSIRTAELDAMTHAIAMEERGTSSRTSRSKLERIQGDPS
jgi:hypothetical protein